MADTTDTTGSLNLSEAQRKAAYALARGQTRQDAADTAGVTARTIRRWCSEPAFCELMKAIGGEAPTGGGSRREAIEAELWRLARGGSPTARISALRTLHQLEADGPAEVDWTAVDVDGIPPEARARLLGRLCQLEARDRSANQLLVARCTGLEVEPVVADRIASAWLQPSAELVQEMERRGVLAALEDDARRLETQHRARD